MTDQWQNCVITPEQSIMDAVKVIEATGLRVALVVGGDGTLKGVVTDGDVRRAILRGSAFDEPVTGIMNHHPVVLPVGSGAEEIIKTMRQHGIREIPIVDDGSRLQNLVTLDEVVSPTHRDNIVVIMAGGEGLRLRPRTESLPKPMLKVGDKPLLETNINRLVSQGFTKIYIALNYLGETIINHFDNGEKWHAEINYLHEEEFLGTAGALSLLPARPDTDIIVMNGDILTDLEFGRLLDFHAQHDSDATMCVREHETISPYGVVDIDDHKFLRVREKPSSRYFINAGVYVVAPEALNFVPEGTFFNMTDLFQALSENEKNTVVFPLTEYWSDIGREKEYQKANSEYDTVFLSAHENGAE